MEINQISRDELVALMNSGKTIKIVDVRESNHFAKVHIKNAISIPISELRTKAKDLLQKDDTIIVYCVNFECPLSTTAYKILTSHGYTNVYDYKGGLFDYMNANLPLIDNRPPKTNAAAKITFQKKPLTLMGRKLIVKTSAPNFKVVDNNLKETTIDDFKNKYKVITSFPSLDTPICDLQVKEFNKRTSEFGPKVVILGISKDLPFAQQRFCQVNEIKNLVLLSDYKFSSFGINYGLLIKEMNLLARSIIIIDDNNIIRYIQIVDELTEQPNYDDAAKGLTEIINNPQPVIKQITPLKCVPCEEDTPPLPKSKIDELIVYTSEWQLIDDKKLIKEFKFKDFVDAKYFLDLLAIIAEEQGHHPNFTLIYNKLKITLTTHASGGLTDNDFTMARIIDEFNV